MLAVSAGLMLAGCRAPAASTGPTELVLDIPDYDRFVDASLSVLRRHDFPPEQVDRRRGLIVSRPTTSGQWFEWWRSDSQGGYQLLESSLHTIRRIVTVAMEPLVAGDAAGTPAGPDAAEPGGGGRYRLVVRVDKERYCAPQRQVTTASGALAIYSERLPTAEGLRGARSRDEHWVALGRDALLEAVLLAALADALPEVGIVQ